MSSWVLMGAGFLDEVALFFEHGGPFLYVNVAVAAIAVAMIIERSISLLFRYSINGAPFMEQITKLVLTGNIDRAVKLCARGAAEARAALPA
jgi:hypothetical protein